MISLSRLKAANCRFDGLSWDSNENPIFNTTALSGPWTNDQKNAVLSVLGKVTPTVTPQGLCFKVDEFRDSRLKAGYNDVTTGKVYQCNDQSVARWTALATQSWIAMQVAAGGGPAAPNVNVIAADNTQITLSANDAFNLFSVRVAPWVQATIFFARTMKNNILAGNPPADITVGWP